MKKILITFGIIILLIISITIIVTLLGKTNISFIDDKICSSMIYSKYSVSVVVAKNKNVDILFVSNLSNELKKEYAGDGKICSYKQFDKVTKEIDKDWEKAFWGK